MNRRSFLRMLGISSVGVSASLRLSCVQKHRRSVENYAWLTFRKERDDSYWQSLFAKMRSAGFGNGLLLGGREKLPRLIGLAAAEDVQIHQWIIALNCRDRTIQRNHPDWFTVSRNGESSLDNPPYVGYYKWLCPSRSEVVEHLKKRVVALADQHDLASVHLDYIRHADVILPVGLWQKYNLIQDREYPEFDFCYCSVCRDAFQSKTGIDPVSLDNPSASAAWKQFRLDSVTSLVNVLYEAVHARGNRLTAAVFPSPSIARTLVRQDWPNWRLDGVMPMMYHQYYHEGIEWIGRVTREGVNALKRRTPLYSGLFVSWFTPDEMRRARELAIKNGASGITLFTAHAMTDEHWKALKTV